MGVVPIIVINKQLSKNIGRISFFKLSSQRSLREHSHRSKGKQTRERLRILQKNGMRIHYNDAQKPKLTKCRLLHGGFNNG